MEVNKKRYLKQRSYLNTMAKIVVILLIPVVIIMTFAVINNAMHLGSYKELLLQDYSSELDNFLTDTEDEMNAIISSAYFITSNSNIETAMASAIEPDSKTTFKVLTAIESTLKFSKLIDNISLYNRNAGFVINSTGIYNAQAYFDSVYPYTDYPVEYWQKYSDVSKSMQTLPPSKLKSDIATLNKTVVPFVFTTQEDNLIIFNINIDTLFENFEIHKLTPNTQIYMIDNSTSELYSHSSEIIDITSQHVIDKYSSSSKSSSDIVSVDGKKYLSVRSRANLWGYTYMLTIPYSDIDNKATGLLLMAAMFILVLFIILALYVIIGTRVLYHPWRNLAITASSALPHKGENGTVPKDIATHVSDILMNISNANKSLTTNLEVSLPLSREKYLIDILNNDTEHHKDDMLDSLHFKYDYFVSVSVSISLNTSMFSDSQLTGEEVLSELKSIIKMMFSQSFITYKLPGDNGVLYLLLNVEDDNCSEEIYAVAAKINELLVADADNVNVVFGMGNIYKGIDGLKLTHREAIANMVKELNSTKIQVFSSKKSKYTYNTNSENVLTNYLIAGYTEKAKEFLDNVYESINADDTKSEEKSYVAIIMTLQKIMKQKGIESGERSAQYMLDSISKSGLFSIEEIRSYIASCIELISESINTNSRKVDIQNVVEYIGERYTDNINLDELAQMYNTSAKYLSKRIKQFLNMPFKDYITNLRIDKAKELLENTDITVSELYWKVGFSNRSAFIRAFKLKTGLAPTEYKKGFKN